jgi:oleandomycin transport system ATP-binding protein
MVIDSGSAVAAGAPAELKALAGGQVLEVRPLRSGDAARAMTELGRLTGAGQPAARDGLITVHVPDEDMVTAAARSLDAAAIPVRHLAVRLPSLDEAFLEITGHYAGADAAPMLAGASR